MLTHHQNHETRVTWQRLETTAHIQHLQTATSEYIVTGHLMVCYSPRGDGGWLTLLEYKRQRPIPCHMCYSLDSIFCKQLRKLSILNDIHILVYYFQWTYIHVVSIGIEIFQTPPLIFPHDHILLCHACYLHQTISILWHDSAKCKVLWSIGVMDNKSILSTLHIVGRTISAKYSWEQVKYNTHNAYQAVSRVLHEFVTCVNVD